MSATNTRTVRMAMKPRGALCGKVVALGFAGGDLYWFGSDGQQSESVPIKPDGTFRYMREHRPDEVIVVVTTNLPLYIQRQPMLLQGDDLRIVIPPAPRRSFEVSISDDLPQRDALVTVAVGDLIVPYPAFAQHLAYHGSMLDLRNRGPLLVPDILETAPLSVLLGPSPNEIGPALRRIDLFRLPQYRGVPRKPVTAARVIF
jgi:hypothetical protein